MRRFLALPLVIAMASVVTPAWQSLRAQEPVIPTDSVHPDSVVRGSIHPPVIPVAVALLVAPYALLEWAGKHTSDTAIAPVKFGKTRLAVYGTGGPALAYAPGPTWAYSANIEAGVDNVYAEASIENFRLPEYVQFRTFRVGYLVHPKPSLAGGITVGYRTARGVQEREGVEIGLPLMYGWRWGWTRFEPTYVVSWHGVDWSYRFQAEVPIGDGPFFAGFNVVAKALPLRSGSRIDSVSPAMVLGVKY